MGSQEKSSNEERWKKFSRRLRRVEFLNIIYMVILPILISRVMWLEYQQNELGWGQPIQPEEFKSTSQKIFQTIGHEVAHSTNTKMKEAKFPEQVPAFSIIEKIGQKAEIVKALKKNEGNHKMVSSNSDNLSFNVNQKNIETQKVKQSFDIENSILLFNDYEKKRQGKKSSISRNEIEVKEPTEYINPNVDHLSTLGNRKLRSSLCSMFPMLSPSNTFNNFTYDDRISKTLDMIYSLSSMEAVHKPGTPQYWSTCWLIYDDIYETQEVDRETVERYAFGIFLYAMNKNFPMPTEHICDYDLNIMNCTEEMLVSQIRYTGSDEGSIIPSELSRFEFLETLDLRSNNLIGTVPIDLGRMLNLKNLLLNHNHLSGTIPSEIEYLTNLKMFNLQENALSGTIPSKIGLWSKLENFVLDRNQLEGSIPVQIFECKTLQVMSFFGNDLNGTISTNIGELQDLEILFLGANQFSGSIPSEIGNIKFLKFFHADMNILTGSIPEEIHNLHFLERLWLNNNFLTGHTPDAFGNMTELFSISLSNNQLSGPIPTSFWEMENIDELFIHQNMMTGTIPNSFCEEHNQTSLTSDLGLWFIDAPKVTCDCCERVDCSMWENPTITCFGKFDFDYTESYMITDFVTGLDLRNSVGKILREANMCLSPTGCYEFNYFDEESKPVNFQLSYSNSKKLLVKQQQCDAVDVCGVQIDQNNPKREGINQLMQIAIPTLFLNDLNNLSTPQAKALCWIMTQDERYDDFSMCDGTLLQRYVLILFLYESFPTFNFTELASKSTCDWDYVVCGPEKKFVLEIIAPDKHLTGTLISELGLLLSLEKINLSNNHLTGSLDTSIFRSMPSLKTFNIGNNSFVGEIPRNLLELTGIEHISLSENKFVGSFSSDIKFSENLEFFSVSDNLLIGSIPKGLTNCLGMKKIDLSKNNFVGFIPSTFGYLTNLEEIFLNLNKLSGSLPTEIFNAKALKVLHVEGNRLTGNIAAEITNMANATEIVLNHNGFKGTIPMGLENLTDLKILHLHQNRLTGDAPPFVPPVNLGDDTTSSYIVDCGNPAFLLPNSKKISCDTCTICCNSDGRCQENVDFDVFMPTVALFCFPFVTVIAFYILSKAEYLRQMKQPSLLCSDDSVYCFIFANECTAWMLHLVTALIQFLLFSVYLQASNLQSVNTDWQYTYRCPDNNVDCRDEKTRSWAGWVLFAIVTTSYLGTDLFQGLLQLQYASKWKDLRVFFSSFLLLSLTLMAFYASITYNIGLAATNTDLIMNAVILLFINDLDEQILSIVETVAPAWTERQIEAAKENLNSKSSRIVDDLGDETSAKGIPTSCA